MTAVQRRRVSQIIGTFIVSVSVSGLMLIAGIKPVQAQETTYTLSGVTFTDGATASGYFDFNPTTGIIGPYDMITTNGITDSLLGITYIGTSAPGNATDAVFFGPGSSELFLYFLPNLTSTGTFTLRPGGIVSSSSSYASIEFTGSTSSTARAINAGTLTASPAALSAPETSPALALALGLVAVASMLMFNSKRRLTPA